MLSPGREALAGSQTNENYQECTLVRHNWQLLQNDTDASLSPGTVRAVRDYPHTRRLCVDQTEYPSFNILSAASNRTAQLGAYTIQTLSILV